MDITISVSEKTEKKIRKRAEATGQDIGEIVGELVEEVWDEHFPALNEKKSHREHSLFKMAGMFSSGYTDTSEHMSNHRYDDDLDPHQGFGTDK